MPLPLTTDRLLIERFAERHLNNPSYMSWLSDRDNLSSLNLIDYMLNPVTQDKLTRYYESFKDNTSNHLFAVCLRESERFIGTATLREIGYRGLFDLGILVGDKSMRGKGLAKEVIRVLVGHAFNELGARKICSSFSEENVAVMLVFLKNGFKIEGCQREQQVSIDGRVSSRYIVGLVRTDLLASS
jgi:RimJ/RimL family protein N-acetyltransferase